MRSSFQFAGIVLLAAATAMGAQIEKGAKKNAVPGGSGLFRPAPKGGGPKGAPKGTPKEPAPRLANPNSLAAHLYRASSEERDRALEKLPQAMQQRLRNELEQFDRLSKEQQELRIRQTERFDALSREQKLEVLAQFQALNRLERDRKQAVSAALRRLHNLEPEERARILARPAFRGRFSTGEWQIISTLAESMLPPL